MSKRILNIQFTEKYIYYGEIKKDGSVVYKYGKIKIDKGIIQNNIVVDVPRFTQLMNEEFKQKNIKTKEVNILIPRNSLFVKKIKLPKNISNKDVKSYINSNLYINISLPISDAKISYKLIEKTNEALIYTVSKELTHMIKRMILECEKVVVDLNVATTSFFNFFDTNYDLELIQNKNLLIVQQIENNLYLYIIENLNLVYFLNSTYDETNNLEKNEWILHQIETITEFYEFTLKNKREKIDTILLRAEKKIASNLELKLKNTDFNVMAIFNKKVMCNDVLIPDEFISVVSPCKNKHNVKIKFSVEKIKSQEIERYKTVDSIILSILIIILGFTLYQFVYNVKLMMDINSLEKDVSNISNKIIYNNTKAEYLEIITEINYIKNSSMPAGYLLNTIKEIQPEGLVIESIKISDDGFLQFYVNGIDKSILEFIDIIKSRSSVEYVVSNRLTYNQGTSNAFSTINIKLNMEKLSELAESDEVSE
ncbi:MAG: hypothetical protein ACK5HP_03825 [Bacilli bacterium]